MKAHYLNSYSRTVETQEINPKTGKKATFQADTYVYAVEGEGTPEEQAEEITAYKEAQTKAGRKITLSETGAPLYFANKSLGDTVTLAIAQKSGQVYPVTPDDLRSLKSAVNAHKGTPMEAIFASKYADAYLAQTMLKSAKGVKASAKKDAEVENGAL
jgi:hypothetical protein